MQLALLLLAAALLAGDAKKRTPDLVVTASGARLGGRVVYEDDARVVVQDGSRTTEVARRDVKELRSRAALSRALLERWNALAPTDVPGLVTLAQSAREKDLLEEAELFAWHALVLDPRNEAAHLLLGHARRGEGWTFQDGARRWPFEKRDEVHREFGSAWRLEGPHFTLRTNLPVAAATTLALDLENAYQAFYSAFGRELGLHELLVPLGADVHADKASFPEQVGGRTAWFDRDREVLVVDASRGFDRGSALHEATHALLHATSTRARNSPGAIPAWVDEGLAEYMAWSFTGEPGRARFAAGGVAKAHFERHAGAKDAYDLARVLTFGSSDYTSSSQADLKYSESYTLVHFLLHGDGGALRPRFLAFVLGAYQGQGSPTHFKKAMGGDAAALERGWNAWVLEHAR
ncbi:MAG: DUF1570 domain-containing protein [Planctomycetes bacterium]|nr:DUF1570 domain-containing protein [Planctomycetota bacterium]